MAPWYKKPVAEIAQDEQDTAKGAGIGHAEMEHVVGTPSATMAKATLLEAPEFIRNMTPEERRNAEERLKRKIDFRLLPMIILMYILNYLDRNNIASARLQGLQEDLGMSDTQYLTTVSILFVGYLLMQVPSNLFLNKIGKPAIYLPTAMVIWGIISMATAAAQNFGGMLAIRFFLGFIEAAYFPGCLFYLSSWYTRKELGFRTAVLYSGSLLSGAFSGLIAAGILKNLNGAKGIAAWRWLFIIEGALTIAVACSAFFVLPNFPATTSWLSPEERELAIYRLKEDVGQDDWINSEEQTFGHGFVLAIKDIKTWILMLLVMGIVSSGSVTNFFPSVTKTVVPKNPTGGISPDIEALLLTAPPYVLCVITTYINAWHADRTGERYWHITIPLWVAVISFIIAVTTSTIGPRYFAMMIMIPGVYSGYVVALAWISNTLPRPPAKRAASLALINAVSNASSIYASYMYVGGPKYTAAFTVDCLTAFMAICCATLLRFILVRLNKKLDAGEVVEGAVGAGAAVPGEGAKKGFRFVY